MPTAHADISTASPDRFAEELTNRLAGSASSGTDDSTIVLVEGARAEIATAPSLLSIQLDADDESRLDSFQEKVTQMLLDLDDAGELAVEWHRLS